MAIKLMAEAAVEKAKGRRIKPDQRSALIALVWPESNSDAEIPYQVRFGVRENGWSCTCPHHIYRGASCKHIKAVRFIRTEPSPPMQVQLTEYGASTLKVAS